MQKNLDAEQLDFLANQARLELARRDIGYFMNYVMGYTTLRHQAIWFDYLMDEDTKQLIFICPPGHAKTTSISVAYSAWYIGNHPTHHVILLSSTATQAQKLSVAIRDLVANSPRYREVFPSVRPDETLGWGQDRWYVKRDITGDPNATMLAAGVPGPILGARANLMILDDVVDSENTSSQLQRETLSSWIKTTAFSRWMTVPGARAVVVGCLVGDTPITMYSGVQKPIREIQPGDRVLGWKEGKLVEREVLGFASQGEDDVFEVRTSGHRVVGNAKHPFLVNRWRKKRRQGLRKPGFMYTYDLSVEWVQLKDLRRGDKIACLRVVKGQETSKLSVKEAWLLGFMFGDGWVTKVGNGTSTYVSKRTGEIRVYKSTQVLRVCVAASAYPKLNQKILDHFTSIFHRTPRLGKFGYYNLACTKAGKWFIEHGLVGGAKGKRVPAWMFSQPVRVREAFLSGFAEADGHEVCNSKGPRIQVELCNKGLVEDLRQLARMSGYRTTNVYSTLRLTKAPHSKEHGWHERNSVAWSKRGDGEFGWSTVKSVTPLGKQEVFDIQVDDCQNFIADGLVTHNTRFSELDFYGELIADPTWTLIHMPAIGYWGPNTPLCPEIMSLDSLLAVKNDPQGGRLRFEGLYQGNPTVPEGAIIKGAWWKRIPWKQMPAREECDLVVQSWDTAFKKKAENDYSVCVTLGLYKGNIFIYSIFRDKLEWPDLLRRSEELYRQWKPRVVLIEDKASGQSLIQSIQSSNTMIPVLPVKADSDQYARVNSQTGFIEAGRVWVPGSSSVTEPEPEWVETLVKECSAYPNGAHDDQVIALVQGIKYLTANENTSRLDPKGYITQPSGLEAIPIASWSEMPGEPKISKFLENL